MTLHTENFRTFSRPGASRLILSDTEKKESKNTAIELIWRWTCKEAAFKILMKAGHQEAFSPSQFSVVAKIPPIFEEEKTITGSIFWENKRFFFQSDISQDYIYTLAFNCPKEKATKYSSIIYNETSINLDILYSLTGRNYLAIQKTSRNIPYLSAISGEILNYDVSISNDEEFTAITIIPGL
jgi:phosphopantetheinyl transferase (holo-ACP synthase)